MVQYRSEIKAFKSVFFAKLCNTTIVHEKVDFFEMMQ